MSEPASTTRTYDEAGQAPDALRRHTDGLRGAAVAAAARLRALEPPLVATCARGSSGCAATYAKSLIETRLQIPVLAQAHVLASVFEAPAPGLKGAAMLAMSQSGRSQDLLLTAKAAQAAGALLICMVNDEASPLAASADLLFPLSVGSETSVAATKSFIATLAALLALVSEWADADDLRAASRALPDVLDRAWGQDWSSAVAPLADSQGLYVLGRGLTLGAARETALKLKETAGLHAEAFSTAEVVHGPAALIGPGFPVLVIPPTDAAAAGIGALVETFRARGALTIVVGEGFGGDIILPIEAHLPAEVQPIAAIQSVYKLVNAVALKRGRNPDAPPFLQKVTYTR
jgi:glucosamine--fructose-6-phosphate aminotransferase (isomerizing)